MISSELGSDVSVETSETKVSTGATDSSLATGLVVFVPHPDRRNRAEMSSNVCFMGAKVAIPLEFLLSYMVKDTETTEKKPYHPVMDDTAMSINRPILTWQSRVADNAHYYLL